MILPATDPASTPVVTLRSLLQAEGLEAPASGFEASDNGEHARFERVLAKLRQETAASGSEVLIAVEDEDTSVLQSRVSELGNVGSPLPAGGLEAKFGEGPAGGDIWGWIRSVFGHVSAARRHPIARPPDTRAATMADGGRIAIVGDWGTNLYGAPVSAASIARTGGYEMLMHLGDVYYSGTPSEMQQRFLDAWPIGAGKVSRALNGNHEMYSGGWAYFDHVLPQFGQGSSYFAARNAHWVLIGLDTACTDHALDEQQVSWLQAVIQESGGRKVILFSHHQPFSRLDGQGPKLQAALSDLLGRQAITAWYWGHEHNCVLYEKHERFGLLGRCIGHGGIPAPRKSDVRSAPVDQALAGITWRRFGPTGDAPACVVLDGANPLIPGEEEKFAPHGYLTLEFAGPDATERVHLPDGTEIFRGRVA